MKKWILLIIVTTIGLNVLNAQTFSQGDKAIAVRVSYLGLDLSKSIEQNVKKNIYFGLKGDYFLIDKLALTAGVDYSNNNGDNSMLGDVGCKYYFWKCIYGGVLYQGLYDFGRLNSRGKIEIGASYYITDKIFIEPAIYFVSGEHAVNVKKVETLSQIGLAVSVGVNF